MKICVDCKSKIMDVNALKCPTCSGWHFTYGPPSEPLEEEISNTDYTRSITKNTAINSQENSVPTVEDLAREISRIVSTQNIQIQAQNRTTHAVRAFVRFLFIQLAAITLAVAIWQLSNQGIDPYECAESGEKCSPNSFLQLVSIGIWIVGIVWSSIAGWSELEKSEV